MASGSWGRAYGYDLRTLMEAADTDQFFHTGDADPGRDQYFIKFGYHSLK